MSLKDLEGLGGRKQTSRFRRYGSHPADDTLWEMVDELQERFPGEIEIDFIEVAPHDVKYDGKAYWRTENEGVYQYIRVSESALLKSEERTKRVLAHEMVHLYCFQNGHTDVSDGDSVFHWLLGHVEAQISHVDDEGSRWKDLVEPMIRLKNWK